MNTKIQLVSLNVSDFRGARAEIKIPLEKQLNIVAGPNASGKSTCTTAVECALYPRQSTLQKEHGIAERRDWEVNHIHSASEPSINLKLSREGKIIDIQHPCLAGKGIVGDTDVHCSYGDFNTLVFSHQETLRDFLVGPPSARNRAFQRLVGVGWSQDLATVIAKGIKNLNCDRTDARVQGVNDVINARLSEARHQLKEAETTAHSAGMCPPWDQAGSERSKRVAALMEPLCKMLGIAVPALPSLDSMSDYSTGLAPVLEGLRARGPAQTHAELARRKTLIESARSRYHAADEQTKRTQTAYGTAMKESGNEEQLAASRSAAKKMEAEIVQERASLGRRVAVIQEALAYFKVPPGTDVCPVCGKKVSGSIVAELERHLAALSTDRDREIGEQLESVRNKLRGIDCALVTLRNLKVNVGNAANLLCQARIGVEAALGRSLRSDEDPMAVTAADIKRLESELAAVSKAVQRQQASINEIGAIATSIDQIGRIVHLQRRLEKLGTIKKSEEWIAMLKAQQELSRYEQILRHAEFGVKEMGARIAHDNLRRGMEPITAIYQRLTRRADFPRITISSENGFAIQIVGEPGTYSATALLNLTDLNSLAIAIVAGMATTFSDTHDMGFLILDDPSQGMDETVAGRLGEVISELSKNIQIMVATADIHLIKSLEESPRSKNIIRLKPRDVNAVKPFVEIESVTE